MYLIMLELRNFPRKLQFLDEKGQLIRGFFDETDRKAF